MEIALIIAGIFFMYARTWLGKGRFNYIIDDNVRRWEYLYVIPTTSPSPQFYSSKPHPWRHFFLSIVHALNTFAIYLIFDWKVALLFAFNPINVNGAAWITGGYYAVTCFLTLTAFYFFQTFPNIFGALTGSLFYTAALGSTITCIGFPFIFIFGLGTKWGLASLWPLATYLFGKRFITGFKIRNSGKGDKITWRKPAVMTKVVAYYIRLALYPNKLAFFRQFGFEYNRNTAEKIKMDSYNKDFWISLLVVGAFVIACWQISPLGTAWFLFFICPFSQFKLLGQFVAERYLYLPNVGICLIMATLVGNNPILLTILATLYFYRAHLYIPAFKNIESLYKYGIRDYPESVTNYCNLGERKLHIGETLQGYRLFEEALKMAPDSFLAHTNLAAYWIGVRNFPRALYHTRIAMKNGDPVFAHKLLATQEKNLLDIIDKSEKIELKNKEGWKLDEHMESVRPRGSSSKKEKVAGTV
jgi:tetratricopeptide (TPR) repeat protein